MNEEKLFKEAEKVFSLMYLEPDLFETGKKAIKQSARAVKEFHEAEVNELKNKLNKITNRIIKLRDLYLHNEIDKLDYDQKLGNLLVKEEKLIILIKAYYETYDATPDNTILFTNMLSDPYKTFKEASLETKKKLIKIVFSNIKLKGYKFEYTLNTPFDMLMNDIPHQSFL